MFYKILFVFYVISTLTSIKSMFKIKDVRELIDETLKTVSKDMLTIIMIIISFLMTLLLLVFYAMSYKISPVMGWLSTFQFVWAIRNFFKVCGIMNSYENGTLKKPSFIRGLIFNSFDVFYGYLVLMYLIG